MSSTTDLNIVLSQGSAIKDIHNVKKQSLEMNQQFVAQKVEQEKKEQMDKIQEPEKGDKVEIKGDGEKKEERKLKKDGKDSKTKKPEEESDSFEGKHIDIRV